MPRRGNCRSSLLVFRQAQDDGSVFCRLRREDPGSGRGRGLSSETRGNTRSRYCFLVSAGFSVGVGASTLPASALGCVAPVGAGPIGAAGVAAFGSTFLASLSALGLLVAGWAASLLAAGVALGVSAGFAAGATDGVTAGLASWASAGAAKPSARAATVMRVFMCSF